jgi:hypothetical protein
MAGAGPLTLADLAKKTGTNERYMQKRLEVQVCTGYITYNIRTRRCKLPKERALVLADGK